MKRTGFLLIFGACLVLGCTRPPQALENPLLRVTYDGKADLPYLVKVEGRISNRNDSLAFIDYSADVVLVNGTREIARIPAARKDILPFARVILSAEKRFPKEGFSVFAEEYKIDVAALEKNGSAEPVYLKESQVKLDRISAKSQSILSVLKEGKK